jgi:hypothetical protein
LETRVPSARLFERRKEDPIVYMWCEATLTGSLLCVTFLLAS